jgi:hypothetical protein
MCSNISALFDKQRPPIWYCPATKARFIQTFLDPVRDNAVMSSALASLEGLAMSTSLLPQLPMLRAFVDQLKQYRLLLEDAHIE